jgi:hypothetical protein
MQFRFGQSTCRSSKCGRKALQLSVFCLQHHVECLQRAGILPQMPLGRWFPPYSNTVKNVLTESVRRVEEREGEQANQ